MPKAVAADSLSLTERVRATLADNPGAMTLQLARDFGVPEADILRCLPAERVAELDLGRWQELLERLPALGQVHVIVSNGAATLESVGTFGNFSTWGEFFNVQTKSLDMHIRFNNLGAIFAVEKPSHMTGINTLSIQFYDRAGAAAFKVFLTFGSKAATAEQTELFARLRDDFRLQS